MRGLVGSLPLFLSLGMALSGCRPGGGPAEKDIPATFENTQANQVVLRVDGLV